MFPMLSFRSLLLFAVTTGLLVGGGPLHAEETSTKDTKAASLIMDLGHIDVENVEPIRNQTHKIGVRVRLLLAEEADEQTLAALEHWRHRLRDQVIVAIRSSNTVDFLEPDLERLRRQIGYRLKRALKSPLVEEVLLADYSFAIR